MTKSSNKIRGAKGEQAAKSYLENLGYKIIEQNWHYSKLAEIDIIAQDRNCLVFVEVKYRSTLGFGHPLESISKPKLQKIYTAALAYLQIHQNQYKNYRIDAIAITGTHELKIEHLKNLGLE